jgi:nitric oxide reductase large subunit
MENKPYIYEPPIFWFISVIVLVIMAITIALFIWFVYIGHEPLEPVHDENPHASAANIFRPPNFLKV